MNRIILARPAVEAGERLGFLPGTLQEKIDPYLRPLYDALYDMMDPEKVDRYLEKNVIEIAPIAFMRGRTLNDSFVILDEAQNTTSEQMKMFVTRLGFQLQGGDHRRRHPDRFAERAAERAAGGHGYFEERAGARICLFRRGGRGAASSGAADYPRLRRAQNESFRGPTGIARRQGTERKWR